MGYKKHLVTCNRREEMCVNGRGATKNKEAS